MKPYFPGPQVQYPDALRTMEMDLGNIRLAAQYLSKTELSFDLVSPVDELAKQIRMEFDFEREAAVMDAIGGHLRVRARCRKHHYDMNR